MIMIDMEMPDNCCECRIRAYDEDEYCPWTGIVCLSIGRQDKCPLSKVPEHGDLVDRNKILQCARPAENFPPNTQVVVYGIIRDAPAVIPAKGEKHDSAD